MAALTAVTITCPSCREPVTVPVVLTTTDEHDSTVSVRRSRTSLADPGTVTVRVRFERTAVLDHDCPAGHDPRRRTAA